MTPIRRKQVLDPMDRISEVLFGLIMVITVTCTVSLRDVNSRGVKNLLLASLGCNIAWGIIDAVFYLMSRFSEREEAFVHCKHCA